MAKTDDLVRAGQALGLGRGRSMPTRARLRREVPMPPSAGGGGGPGAQLAGLMSQFPGGDPSGVAPEALGSRISQRFPTAIKTTEDPLTQNLLINRSIIERDPKLIQRAADVSRGYLNLGPQQREMNPGEMLTALGQHAKENLLHLWDMTPKNIRARASQWYWGANKIANEAAQRNGIHPRAAAGAFAALSPQKDWYQNVYLGNKVLDTLSLDPTATTDMMRVGKTIMTKPSKKSGEEPRRIWTDDDLSRLHGKRLSDLTDPEDKAKFIRLYDEAHGQGFYHTVTPEGERGEVVRSEKTGKPNKAGWGSFNEIKKAVMAAESGGDMNIISPLMGEAHKVRNFYNNIIDPGSAKHGDVTIDTHQVAASLFRPLSGKSREVIQGLGSSGAGVPGGPQSAASGLAGLYPIYADATRQAAQERGVPTIAMQSVPWETIRGIYQPSYKGQKSNIDASNAIWQQHAAGEISADEARQQSLAHAGGYRPPTWWQG